MYALCFNTLHNSLQIGLVSLQHRAMYAVWFTSLPCELQKVNCRERVKFHCSTVQCMQYGSIHCTENCRDRNSFSAAKCNVCSMVLFTVQFTAEREGKFHWRPSHSMSASESFGPHLVGGWHWVPYRSSLKIIVWQACWSHHQIVTSHLVDSTGPGLPLETSIADVLWKSNCPYLLLTSPGG